MSNHYRHMNESTEEPANDLLWKDDLLGRKEDAAFLERFLTNKAADRALDGKNPGSYVMNLNAGWGRGKTFFLTRFCEQLKAAGYIAVYVNAWRDDHAEDPLLSVMSAIDESLKPYFAKKDTLRTAWNVTKTLGLEIAAISTKHLAIQMAGRLIGSGVKEVTELVSNEVDAGKGAEAAADALNTAIEAVADRVTADALAAFRRERTSIETFKERLGTLLVDVSTSKLAKVPLFVFVDELDRCTPSHAIRLLERVKHLFDVPNVVFVVATDSDQLVHSIKAVYGADFDSAAYLRRFFDRAYEFDKPSMLDFARHVVSASRLDTSKFDLPQSIKDDIAQFFANAAKLFGLSLRDLEQCIDILDAAASVWEHKSKIQLIYIFSLVVAFQQNNSRLWSVLTNFKEDEIFPIISNDSDPWLILFYDYDARSEHRRKYVSYQEYLQLFIHIGRNNMIKIAQEQHRSEPSVSIQETFLEENRAERGGVVVGGQAPVSLIYTYPQLVKSAGRTARSVPQ